LIMIEIGSDGNVDDVDDGEKDMMVVMSL